MRVIDKIESLLREIASSEEGKDEEIAKLQKKVKELEKKIECLEEELYTANEKIEAQS